MDNSTKECKMGKQEFCKEVGIRAKDEYDVDDGADLCYNLLDMGVLTLEDSIRRAAQIVAQHILQA